jgi:hypothetical protein
MMPSTGVNDDLYARALVMSDSDKRIDDNLRPKLKLGVPNCPALGLARTRLSGAYLSVRQDYESKGFGVWQYLTGLLADSGTASV